MAPKSRRRRDRGKVFPDLIRVVSHPQTGDVEFAALACGEATMFTLRVLTSRWRPQQLQGETNRSVPRTIAGGTPTGTVTFN
jgi:hypothetical protein